jgi:hypothetical protein
MHELDMDWRRSLHLMYFNHTYSLINHTIHTFVCCIDHQPVARTYTESVFEGGGILKEPASSQLGPFQPLSFLYTSAVTHPVYPSKIRQISRYRARHIGYHIAGDPDKMDIPNKIPSRPKVYYLHRLPRNTSLLVGSS